MDKSVIEAESIASRKILLEAYEKKSGALGRFFEDLAVLYDIDKLPPDEFLQCAGSVQTNEAKRYITLIANKAKPETALSDELFKPIVYANEYLGLRIDPQMKSGTGWTDYLITDPANGNPIAIELKPLHSYKYHKTITRQRLASDYDILKKEFDENGKNQISNYLKDYEYVVFTNMEDVLLFNKEARFNGFKPFATNRFIPFAREVKEMGGQMWDVLKKVEDITPKHELDKHFFGDLKKWFEAFNKVDLLPSVKREEKIVMLLNKFIFLRTLEDYGLIPYNHTISTYDNSDKKWKAKGYTKVFLDFFADIQHWAYMYYDTELFKEDAMNYIIQNEANMREFRVAIEKVLGLGAWDRTFGMGLIHYNYRAINEDIFGTTYEIFLAEQRKEQGIHYTPAFISETMSGSMVDELFCSLRDLLISQVRDQKFEEAWTTAGKLVSIKFLDPSCGSGSFLVKLLRLIWEVYQSISESNEVKWAVPDLQDPEDIAARKKKIIDLKAFLGLDSVRRLIPLIILRHLHGIDLDEKAISVAKVNLWKEAIKLSPKDYRHNTLTGNLDHILPDLEMNLICANSLVDFPEEQAFELLEPFRDILREMHAIRNKYFSCTFDPSPLEKLIELRDGTRKELAEIFKEKYGSQGEPQLFALLNFFYCYFDRDGRALPSSDRGFKGVIGNPPYSVFAESDYFKALPAGSTGNLFGHFIAKGVELNAREGAFSFIVPLSFASGSDFENVRCQIYRNYGNLRSSHYSIRPARLFDGVDQRMTIFLARNKGEPPCVVESSRLYRYSKEEREELVRHPIMGKAGTIKEGFIPRVADDIGASIYKKFLSIGTKIADCCRKTDTDGEDLSAPWWYHSVGRYWLKAYDFTPHFTRDGVGGISANIKSIIPISMEAAKACIAVVNSNLFYFWWIMQSDEFHLLSSEIFSMAIPDSLITDVKVHAATDKLMRDYQTQAERKCLNLRGVAIEMDEIHARKSRTIILEIDELLAPHYDLTGEELKFLQEYDVKFRCGEE